MKLWTVTFEPPTQCANSDCGCRPDAPATTRGDQLPRAAPTANNPCVIYQQVRLPKAALNLMGQEVIPAINEYLSQLAQ